jgi:hypothetical protein
MYDGKGVYKHYKGGEYSVLALGVEEATLTPVVIYQPVGLIMPGDVMEKVWPHDVEYWTRPLDDFNTMMWPGQRRFQRIG